MSNPESSESATVANPRIRILLVDDYRPWRQFMLSKVQQTSVFEVVGEAEDGVEAIEKGLELEPDLILLDIGLPKLSGIEVARCMGAMLPRTKIVFVTQNGDRDLMAQCLSHGAMGYVVKGDAASELVPAIEAVMQGTQYLSRRMKRSAARSGEA